MSREHADYQSISPPADKDPTEYTYNERRGELFDAIHRKGGYRNLDRSQRDLAERYGKVHRTIQNDISAILEYISQHIGENTESEISLIQSRAIEDFLNAAEQHRKAASETTNASDKGDHLERAAECMEKAFEIAMDYMDELRESGEKPKAPDRTELTGEGGSPLNVVIQRERHEPNSE